MRCPPSLRDRQGLLAVSVVPVGLAGPACGVRRSRRVDRACLRCPPSLRGRHGLLAVSVVPVGPEAPRSFCFEKRGNNRMFRCFFLSGLRRPEMMALPKAQGTGWEGGRRRFASEAPWVHGSRIHPLLSENGEIMYLFDHFSSGVLRPEMMALPQARGTGREGGWRFARETPRGCTAAVFILCFVRRGTIAFFLCLACFGPR